MHHMDIDKYSLVAGSFVLKKRCAASNPPHTNGAPHSMLTNANAAVHANAASVLVKYLFVKLTSREALRTSSLRRYCVSSMHAESAPNVARDDVLDTLMAATLARAAAATVVRRGVRSPACAGSRPRARGVARVRAVKCAVCVTAPTVIISAPPTESSVGPTRARCATDARATRER